MVIWYSIILEALFCYHAWRRDRRKWTEKVASKRNEIPKKIMLFVFWLLILNFSTPFYEPCRYRSLLVFTLSLITIIFPLILASICCFLITNNNCVKINNFKLLVLKHAQNRAVNRFFSRFTFRYVEKNHNEKDLRLTNTRNFLASVKYEEDKVIKFIRKTGKFWEV